MVSVLDAFLVLHHSGRANSSFSHTPCSLLNPKPIASGLLHKYFSEHYLAQDSGGIIYVPDTGAKPGEHHVLQGFKKKKVSYKKKKKQTNLEDSGKQGVHGCKEKHIRSSCSFSLQLGGAATYSLVKILDEHKGFFIPPLRLC